MKPMLGQVQSQALLDDLVKSPKAASGKNDRVSNSSFTDVLMAALRPQGPDAKMAAPHNQPQKILDTPPKIERPSFLPTNNDRNRPEPKTVDRDNSIQNNLPSSESKAALTPLKKQFSAKGSTEGLLNGNAVLAFVNGRLDKLDPDALPKLITESPLIKQAMSSGDVAEFMQAPMSIGELAKLFELDQSLLNKAASAGLDPTDMASPKDFINALGLDAGKVTAELTILSEKLPLEGLQAYIQKAKLMAANQSTTQSSGIDQSSNTLGSTTQNKMSIPSARDPNDLNDQESATTRVNPNELQIPVGLNRHGPMTTLNPSKSNPPSVTTPAPNISPTGINEGRTGHQNINQPIDPVELLAMSGYAQALPSERAAGVAPPIKFNPNHELVGDDQAAITEQIISPVTNLSHNQMPGKLSNQISNQLQNKIRPSDDVQRGPDFKNLDVQLISDAVDPYLDLGRNMDQNSKAVVNFSGDGVNQRTLEEHLLAQGLDSKKSLAEIPPVDIRRTDSLVNILNQSAAKPVVDLESNLTNKNTTMLAGDNTLAGASLLTSKLDGALLHLRGDDAGGDHTDGDSHQNSDQNTDQAQSLINKFSDTGTTIQNGGKSQNDSESLFANKLTESAKTNSKDSVSAKILSQAQMLLKSGGGSMRLDVDTPSFGKLNVAINLSNSQLDVRILTHSDHARDIIAREVAGLRDGLGQQGINLRGIEVGKPEASSQQFSGQSHSGFHRGSQDQKPTYNDMRDYAQSFKGSFVDRTKVMTPPPSISAIGRLNLGARSDASPRRLEVRI